MINEKIKIIIIAHNEFEMVKVQKENILLFSDCQESDIIIVDNGSDDGLGEWLKQQSTMDYILCDEGIEGYATILNAVIKEFVQDEDVLIMSPGLFIFPNSMNKLVDLLYAHEQVGAVCANAIFVDHDTDISFASALNYIKQKESTDARESIIGLPQSGVLIKNEMLHSLHEFDEGLLLPSSALIDFSFRGIELNYEYFRLKDFCFYEIPSVQDVYEQRFGMNVDRTRLKEKWKMNYFNNMPNTTMLTLIDEDNPEEFHALEVGCDCGANLLALKTNIRRPTFME